MTMLAFTGKERDAETGLDYFGARYFSGAQGRFTSPDKPFADQRAQDPQSWNLYSYVRNNPLRYVDETGQGAVAATVREAAKRILKNARQSGVYHAWKQEMQMVRELGRGTRQWSKRELDMLKRGERPPGYQGHHISSVAQNSPEMARNPDNVELVKQ